MTEEYPRGIRRRPLGRGFTSEPISEPTSKPIENISPYKVEEFFALPKLAQYYLKAQSIYGYLSHSNCGGYIFGANFNLDGYKVWCEKCKKESIRAAFYDDGVVELNLDVMESLIEPPQRVQRKPNQKPNPQYLDLPIFIEKGSEWGDYDDISSLVGDLTHTCGGDVRTQGRIFTCHRCKQSVEHGFSISPLGICNF